MRKTRTAGRPDATIGDNMWEKIWLVDIVCLNEKNIKEKYQEKLTKYQQLAFEVR